MYSVSNEFKTAISNLDRIINAYVVIDGTIYNSQSVISINYSHGVLGDRFEVGQAPSAYLQVVLRDVPLSTVVDNKTVQAYVGVDVSGTFQYVPLGVFVVDESSRSKNELTIHCQDKMVQLEQEYISTLTYPAQLSAVLGEVLSGFTHSITLPSYLSNYTVPKIVKRTKRQVLGYIAAVCGAFAYVDRDGTFRFKVNSNSPSTTYVQSISGDNYFKMSREDVVYDLFKLNLTDGTTVWSLEENTFGELTERQYTFAELTAYNKQFGSINELVSGRTGFQLTVASPFATQSIVSNLFDVVKDTPLLTYELDWIGNPAIELGDAIYISEFISEGATTNLYVNVGSVSLKYDGGLSGLLNGIGEGRQKNQFSTNGDIASAIEVVQADVADVASTVESVQTDVSSVQSDLTTVQSDLTTVQSDVSTLQSDVSTAQTTADTALASANGKNKNYYQASQPTGTFVVGDMWFDTDNDNRMYRWNGTTWADILVGTNALAPAVTTSITTAQTTADGKNKIYYQTSAPSGGTYQNGDIWFDTDDGNKIYNYQGGSWVAAELGTNAISNLAITGAKIANATISGANIASATIGAANIANATITAAQIADATITGAKIADATIGNAKIANLDAGKITAGTMSASRIGAGTFSTSGFDSGTEGTGYAELKKTELNFLPLGTTTPYFKLFANSSNGVLKWNDGSVTSQISLGTNAELRSQSTAQLYVGGNTISVNSSVASINCGLNVSGAISEAGTALGSKYASIYSLSNYLPLSGGTLTGVLYGTGVSLTGNMYASGNLWSVGAYSNVISTRQVYINSNGSFGTTASTERFKQNIIPYTFDYDKLMNLEVVKFNYKPEISDSTETQYGVIAEQAEAIGLDEFVGYDADGQVDYFAYERLAVANLQLIQKQHEMIKQLEQRIAKLEGVV